MVHILIIPKLLHKTQFSTKQSQWNNPVYILYVGEYLCYNICCVYMYVNTLYRFISIYFRTVIRFYAEYIYSGCDSVRVYSNSFIRPHLNDFIWTLKRCFVFISLFSSDQDFISNVLIVINYCGVFTKYVFFNLFFFLTHVSPICFMIDW